MCECVCVSAAECLRGHGPALTHCCPMGLRPDVSLCSQSSDQPACSIALRETHTHTLAQHRHTHISTTYTHTHTHTLQTLTYQHPIHTHTNYTHAHTHTTIALTWLTNTCM